MKVKATLPVPRLDLEAYRASAHEHLTEILTQAAFEWVTAATDKIPVWSGASWATFLHVSRDIGFQLVIAPKSNAPRRISYGLSNSGGELEADPTTGRYFLHYDTKLKHLIWNEFNNANTNPDPGLLSQLIDPGPYHFQEAAREAFNRVARTARLPSFTKGHFKIVMYRVK
jgi:hypothetical protein